MKYLVSIITICIFIYSLERSRYELNDNNNKSGYIIIRILSTAQLIFTNAILFYVNY